MRGHPANQGDYSLRHVHHLVVIASLRHSCKHRRVTQQVVGVTTGCTKSEQERMRRFGVNHLQPQRFQTCRQLAVPPGSRRQSGRLLHVHLV